MHASRRHSHLPTRKLAQRPSYQSSQQFIFAVHHHQHSLCAALKDIGDKGGKEGNVESGDGGERASEKRNRRENRSNYENGWCKSDEQCDSQSIGSVLPLSSPDHKHKDHDANPDYDTRLRAHQSQLSKRQEAARGANAQPARTRWNTHNQTHLGAHQDTPRHKCTPRTKTHTHACVRVASDNHASIHEASVLVPG